MINIFSNLIPVSNHPRVNHIFIRKVICAHVKFYVDSFHRINFAHNHSSIFQKNSFAMICNKRCTNQSDRNRPHHYKHSKSNLPVSNRNQTSHKNPNTSKNME